MRAWILCSLLLGCTGSPDPAAHDQDGDGYEDVAWGGEDCDDADAAVNPGAEEVCDGVDNDCDAFVDERVGTVWYADADGDGHGDATDSVDACEAPSGYVASDDDCDDVDPAAYPGATESCNEVDDDCDGEVDEDVLYTWYRDEDGDGYGDAEDEVVGCDRPSGYVDDDTDCDDEDDTVHPGATEECNEVDDDCDGEVDDGAVGTTTFYWDGDGDGFGDPDTSQVSCLAGDGWILDAQDCDDTDAAVNPHATEECNEIDDDCDGEVDNLSDGRDC